MIYIHIINISLDGFMKRPTDEPLLPRPMGYGACSVAGHGAPAKVHRTVIRRDSHATLGMLWSLMVMYGDL